MTKIREVERDFEKMAREAREQEEYWVAAAIYDFTEQLHGAMQSREKNKADLAKAIGKSAPYITKILKGGNFTIETMVKLSRALGYSLEVQLVDAISEGKLEVAPNILDFRIPGEKVFSGGTDYSREIERSPAMAAPTKAMKEIGYETLANSA